MHRTFGIFVGRQRELAQIDAALDLALTGRGQLVLLAGEPGIGKTRLADRASAAAAAKGFSVLWGRCWEAGGAPAYWPWLDPLAALVRKLAPATLGETLADGAPLLGELLPEVRRLIPQTGTATPPADEGRFRLWRAVVAVLGLAAESQPLFVVLDDLHAADPASLALLLFVARQLRSQRLVILSTFRDVEARLDEQTRSTIAQIAREATTMSLARLDRADAAAFVDAWTGARPAPSGPTATPVLPDDIAARILDSTQGNPLFLEEMLRLCDEQGATAIAEGTIPYGVRDLIGQRLQRVPAPAREILDLAAIAGDELDRPVLIAASKREPSFVSGCLDDAAAAGVLADRGGRWRFAHALFREVLTRELSDDMARALHGRIATALDELHGASGTHDAELAHHALAGPTTLLPKAVEFALRAATRAQELLAYDEAIRILEAACDAVAVGGNSAELRAPLLVALGEARLRRGDNVQGKSLCREAATLARSIGDPVLGARAALAYGRVFNFGNVDPVLVGLLEESLEALPTHDSTLRARLLARLGAALQPSLDVDEPMRIALEAIATARRLGDDATLLETLHDGISALMDIAPPEQQRALNFEAEALAVRLGDKERLLRTHGRLAIAHMALGELEPADARIAAFDALANRLKAPWTGWRAPLLRAMRATMHGRFAEAEAFADEARAIGRAAKDPIVDAIWTRNHAGILRAAERHEEMLAFEPEVSRMYEGYTRSPVWQTASAALTRARVGDGERTKLYLELLPQNISAPATNLYALFFVAEAVAIAGATNAAEDLYRRIAALPDPFVMLGMSYMAWEGPTARLLGLLAAALRRWDDANAHFEQAAVACRRLGAAPFLARTLYEDARARLRRAELGRDGGTTSDAERAAAVRAAEARAIASDLGMSGLIRLIDALGLGGPAATATRSAGTATPAAAATSAAFTFACEGEYWTVNHAAGSFRLKDSLGLRYLARLLEAPGKEIHVLDLAAAQSGTRGDSGAADVVDAGDAGELIDAEARASYKRRVEDLDDALAEAEAFDDRMRAARLREERAMLAAELARATGLGGRVRRAGGAAERARSAVQRRIRNALDRIAEHAPALAEELTRTVKTGNFCVYRGR